MTYFDSEGQHLEESATHIALMPLTMISMKMSSFRIVCEYV